jgi:opacity protein-like surface antigen
MIHMKFEAGMNNRFGAYGLAACTAFALSAASALAAEQSREIGIFGGELLGDRLTETPVSGATPRLDDTAIFGLRNQFNFNDMWAAQLSTGFTQGRAAHVASGDSKLSLRSIELDAVLNLPSRCKVVPHVELGVGYAWASLDQDIVGLASGRDVDITSSNGYTANVGLGAKYFINRHLFVDFDARYRYYSRLVSGYGRGLNTAQTTLGLGWRF